MAKTRSKTRWLRGNKANQKWSAEDIIVIFKDVLEMIEEDDEIIYIGEVNEYMLRKYGSGKRTVHNWVVNVHKDNEEIQSLWEEVVQAIENRVIKDTEVLRPQVQMLVLKNKHEYEDKAEVKHSGEVTHNVTPFDLQERIEQLRKNDLPKTE